MIVSFLFWNLMKRRLQYRHASIVSAYEVDIVMLAECEVAVSVVEATLKQSTTHDYHFCATISGNDKLHVFITI